MQVCVGTAAAAVRCARMPRIWERAVYSVFFSGIQYTELPFHGVQVCYYQTIQLLFSGITACYQAVQVCAQAVQFVLRQFSLFSGGSVCSQIVQFFLRQYSLFSGSTVCSQTVQFVLRKFQPILISLSCTILCILLFIVTVASPAYILSNLFKTITVA